LLTADGLLVDSSPLVDPCVFLWRQIQVIYAR
jgi:hypothetical protein